MIDWNSKQMSNSFIHSFIHSFIQHARNGSVAVGAAGNRAIARQWEDQLYMRSEWNKRSECSEANEVKEVNEDKEVNEVSEVSEVTECDGM